MALFGGKRLSKTPAPALGPRDTQISQAQAPGVLTNLLGSVTFQSGNKSFVQKLFAKIKSRPGA